VERPQAANPNAGIEDHARQVREMRTLAGEKRRGGNVVLVSHSSTILAATGIMTGPGDMLVLLPQGEGKFEMRGRFIAAPEPR
jgi:broad specificity phosphatase PhoE